MKSQQQLKRSESRFYFLVLTARHEELAQPGPSSSATTAPATRRSAGLVTRPAPPPRSVSPAPSSGLSSLSTPPRPAQPPRLVSPGPSFRLSSLSPRRSPTLYSPGSKSLAATTPFPSSRTSGRLLSDEDWDVEDNGDEVTQAGIEPFDWMESNAQDYGPLSDHETSVVVKSPAIGSSPNGRPYGTSAAPATSREVCAILLVSALSVRVHI